MKKLIYLCVLVFTACSVLPAKPPLSCTAPQQNYLPKEAVSCECVGKELWACKVIKEKKEYEFVV